MHNRPNQENSSQSIVDVENYVFRKKTYNEWSERLKDGGDKDAQFDAACQILGCKFDPKYLSEKDMKDKVISSFNKILVLDKWDPSKKESESVRPVEITKSVFNLLSEARNLLIERIEKNNLPEQWKAVRTQNDAEIAASKKAEAEQTEHEKEILTEQKNVEAPKYVYKEKSCEDWNNILTNTRDNDSRFVIACHLLDIKLNAIPLSLDDVNGVYRNLAKNWHPDKEQYATDGRPIGTNEAVFKLIEKAHKLLLKDISIGDQPKDLIAAQAKLDNILASEFKADENQAEIITESYHNNPVFTKSYYQQEELTPEQEDLAAKLKQQREAMKKKPAGVSPSDASEKMKEPKTESPSVDEDHEPTEAPPMSPFEIEDRVIESIAKAEKFLENKEVSNIEKQEVYSWLLFAKQSQGLEKKREMLEDFKSLKFSTPTSQSSPALNKPTMAVNEEDPRYKVLVKLMQEQKRLMDDYHLVDTTLAKDGIRLETKVGIRDNGNPYYKEGNKTAAIAMKRVNAIGVMAKELDTSLREHPTSDKNMPSTKIHAKLEALRSEMHATGLLKGVFVAGRGNISIAMQLVAPPSKPKASVVESIKRRFSFSK
jgi:hypothetical protein